MPKQLDWTIEHLLSLQSTKDSSVKKSWSNGLIFYRYVNSVSSTDVKTLLVSNL